jgi:methionine-rich copper-binding protein CopC/putative copper export protein
MWRHRHAVIGVSHRTTSNGGDRAVARRREWLLRCVAAAVVVGGLLVSLTMLAAPAWAHAAFVASQPAPGANLAAAPGVVTLRFSEPLIEDLSRVTVTDPNGQEFSSGPTGERKIAVDVDSTAQGPYTVEWKTVSPIDGHTLEATFEFGVGTDVGAHAEPSSAPTGADLLIAGTRTVEYIGLLATLGLLTLAALAMGAGLGWRPEGLHRWVAIAAGGGIATVAGEILLASSGSLIAAAGSFLLAPSGWPRLIRLLTEAAALVVTWRAAGAAGGGRVPQRSARVWGTLLTLASLTALSAAGHAAAGGTYAVGADTLHLWSAGVWAGALVVMLFHRPPDGWRSDTGRALAREFSPIAISMFVATVLLGSVRGWQELAAFSDLWRTAYGQVLTVKVAMVLAMVPLSLLAWRRRRLHARTEGTLAVTVVVAAAVLAAFPVPPGRAGDEVAEEAGRATEGLPQPGDLTLAKGAGETVVGLSIRPAEPGINDLYVHLVPPGGSDEAGPLTVRLTPPDAPASEMRSCGTACRVATLPLDGGETIGIEVSGEDGGRATFALPPLPAPDGSELAAALTERMQQVDALRYDEVFGPMEPPVTSTWEIVAPDRIHGTMTGGTDFREIIRIRDRRWTRESPDGPWQGGEPGGPVVNSNRFIWDYPNKTAARIIGTDTVDGAETRIVSFFVDVGGLAIWYRLSVDGDDRVRRAAMRAQGHFMDHRYYDLDAPITIQPPT